MGKNEKIITIKEVSSEIGMFSFSITSMRGCCVLMGKIISQIMKQFRIK